MTLRPIPTGSTIPFFVWLPIKNNHTQLTDSALGGSYAPEFQIDWAAGSDTTDCASRTTSKSYWHGVSNLHVSEHDARHRGHSSFVFVPVDIEIRKVLLVETWRELRSTTGAHTELNTMILAIFGSGERIISFHSPIVDVAHTCLSTSVL